MTTCCILPCGTYAYLSIAQYVHFTGDVFQNIGLQLKALLTSVDELMPQLPDDAHTEVSLDTCIDRSLGQRLYNRTPDQWSPSSPDHYFIERLQMRLIN